MNSFLLNFLPFGTEILAMPLQYRVLLNLYMKFYFNVCYIQPKFWRLPCIYQGYTVYLLRVTCVPPIWFVLNTLL